MNNINAYGEFKQNESSLGIVRSIVNLLATNVANGSTQAQQDTSYAIAKRWVLEHRISYAQLLRAGAPEDAVFSIFPASDYRQKKEAEVRERNPSLVQNLPHATICNHPYPLLNETGLPVEQIISILTSRVGLILLNKNGNPERMFSDLALAHHKKLYYVDFEPTADNKPSALIVVDNKVVFKMSLYPEGGKHTLKVFRM